MPACSNFHSLPCSTAFLEDVHADFKFAVKAAVVDHLFGDIDGSAHLASADVQPVRPERIVPEVGMVSLAGLPEGVLIATEGSGRESVALQVDSFGLLLSDIQRGGILGDHGLLRALQSYFKELDVSNLKVYPDIYH